MSNVYELARGETETFTGVVRDLANALVDLTGAKVYFTVRGLDDVIVLTKKNLAAGGGDTQIEILDQVVTKGQYKLKLGHADTDLASTARWADCWVVTAAGEYIQVDARAPFYITGAETQGIA